MTEFYKCSALKFHGCNNNNSYLEVKPEYTGNRYSICLHHRGRRLELKWLYTEMVYRPVNQAVA